jgi:hypothetical protein
MAGYASYAIIEFEHLKHKDQQTGADYTEQKIYHVPELIFISSLVIIQLLVADSSAYDIRWTDA